MQPDSAAPSPVSTQASRGHRSTLLAQALRIGCKAISVVVLARLLTPAEHGLYAMAASVFLFLFLFRDFNLGTAALQAPTLAPTQLATLAWAHLALGGGLMLLTLAAAPLAERFYITPGVGTLLGTMSLGFVCIGVGGLPRNLLARELRFAELNFVETTGAIVGTAATIAAAALHAGAFALVAYLLVSEAVIAALAWRVCGRKLLRRPEWASLRPLLRTGRELTLYHALNYVLNQIDTFAIGHVLGARPLGLYNRAGQLLGLANLHVASPLAQVGLAALTRIPREDEEFQRQAHETGALIGYLTLPAAAVCVAVPDEAIRLVLGEQWPDAAPVLRWSAVSLALLTASRLAYSINVAAGQTRRLTLTVIVSLPFTAVAVWAGLKAGAASVALALALVNLALFGPRLWWMLRGSPLSVANYLNALAGPFAFASAVGAGAALGAAAAGNSPWHLRFAAAGLGGLALAGILLAVLPRLRRETRRVWDHLPGASFFTKPPNP